MYNIGKFSSSDLQSIFKAAKNVQVLKFNCCKLDVESGFDLSGEDYTIEELMLFRYYLFLFIIKDAKAAPLLIIELSRILQRYFLLELL